MKWVPRLHVRSQKNLAETAVPPTGAIMGVWPASRTENHGTAMRRQVCTHTCGSSTQAASHMPRGEHSWRRSGLSWKSNSTTSDNEEQHSPHQGEGRWV